jgi:uncharacterized protein (TIGR02678 family)
MNAMEMQEREERRRALRALLARPLLLPEQATFALVRRHASWLGEWFGRYPRWAFQVTPELARVRKTAGDPTDGTRPARDPRGTPFSRRRYVLLCLLLAVLERSDRQTTLGRLVERLLAELADAEGHAPDAHAPDTRGGLGAFALDNRDDRRDLVQVVRLLLDLGVLRRVVGDEDAFVDDRSRDALYDVFHRRGAALLDVRVPPSLVGNVPREARVAAIGAEAAPDTVEARNLALRTRIIRRLLDDPVLYYADLDPDERAYFAKQRPHIVGPLVEATGLVEEARAEGIALVDPDATLTDVWMPEEGTEGHLTLLVAEWLVQRLGAPVTFTAVAAHVRTLAETYRAHWRKDVHEPGADEAFARLAVDRLRALALVRVDGDTIRGLPALARYRVVAPPPPPADAPSLFGRPLQALPPG